MDDGDKITLVRLLDLLRRLLNELHVGSVPSMAFINLISEMVENYHPQLLSEIESLQHGIAVGIGKRCL